MDDLLMYLLPMAALGYFVWLAIVFPLVTRQRLRDLTGELQRVRGRLDALEGVAAPIPAPTPRTPLPTFDFAPERGRAEPVPVPAAAPPKPEWDLESLVGANWLAKLGAAAVVLAVAFFLQYAFASGWIGPQQRVIGGLVVAATMVAAGQHLLGKPLYRRYAQALFSGGIVTYFLSVYAAQRLYDLIGFVPAFAALALGALAVSALAIANDTEPIAALSVLGAFAVPVLIQKDDPSGAAGPAIQLYLYLALLNLWVAVLVRLRPWHSLSIVAFAGTWLLFFLGGSPRSAGWVAEGFASLFLLASVSLGVAAFRETRIDERGTATAGLGLVIGGAVAFVVASEASLANIGLLGLPAFALAPLLGATVLAGLVFALPPLPERDAWVRPILAVAAIVALVGAIPAVFWPAPPLPRAQVPAAFVFSLFNVLLFGALAHGIAKRDGRAVETDPLAIANATVHAVMVLRLLHETSVFGAPAGALWLPGAAAIALAAGQRVPALVLAAAAGFTITTPAASWSPLGALLFFAQFVGLSAVWLGQRSRFDIAAAFVNATAFFALMTRSLGLRDYGGIVLLAVGALAMAIVCALLGQTRRQSDQTLLRLVYLGLGVTFASIAIPLQLRAGFITIAWAVEAAVLIWTGSAASEPRARWYGLALLAIAAGRALTLDLPLVPSPALPLLNLPMLAGASVVAAAYYGFAHLGRVRDTLAPWEQIARIALALLANAFTLLFVSVDLWRGVGQFWPGAGASAQQLALSVFWALYAMGAAAVGIWQRQRPVRLFAMGLLYVAIAKVFLWDLAGLEQPYRIVSFLALGLILLATSLLYTRFEGQLGDAEPESATR